MGKPSIFSHDYKERVKKRRVNTVLFILLLICIAFFGGKYYLNKNDIPAINSIKNSSIYHKISDLNLWTKLKEKFTKLDSKTDKPKAIKVITPAVVKEKPSVTKSAVVLHKTTYQYTYLTKDNNKITIEYEKNAAMIIFTKLIADNIISDYDISKNKDLIVFDIKKEGSLILCDSKGNFKVISRSTYVTSKTHKTMPKESVMARYKNYVWAEKPHFTLDGRISYISRLPYIRADNTLYFWTVNLDGTNHKRIFMLNNDITKISYGGFDNTERLIVKVDNKQYYLANGSYTLKEQ